MNRVCYDQQLPAESHSRQRLAGGMVDGLCHNVCNPDNARLRISKSMEEKHWLCTYREDTRERICTGFTRIHRRQHGPSFGHRAYKGSEK